MIKRVAYNSNIKPLGNMDVYDGKQVYVDTSGQYCFGWHYTPQRAITGVNRSATGLWVAAENTSKYVTPYWEKYYVLMDENLTFPDVPLRGLEPNTDVYNGYAYPWAFKTVYDYDIGDFVTTVVSENNSYTVDGDVLLITSAGETLTMYSPYDDSLHAYTHFYLQKYNSSGSIVSRIDLMPVLEDPVFPGQWLKVIDWCAYCNGIDISTWITSPAGFIIYDIDNVYFTVEDTNESDPDKKYHHYKCGNNIVVEVSALPGVIQLSDVAQLSIPTLNLIVDGITFNNDPLGLLEDTTNQGAYVSGVHAYKNIIISQKTHYANGQHQWGKIWKNGITLNDPVDITTQPYKCYDLVPIKNSQWNI